MRSKSQVLSSFQNWSETGIFSTCQCDLPKPEIKLYFLHQRDRRNLGSRGSTITKEGNSPFASNVLDLCWAFRRTRIHLLIHSKNVFCSLTPSSLWNVKSLGDVQTGRIINVFPNLWFQREQVPLGLCRVSQEGLDSTQAQMMRDFSIMYQALLLEG